jgi:hypothetical protein
MRTEQELYLELRNKNPQITYEEIMYMSKENAIYPNIAQLQWIKQAYEVLDASKGRETEETFYRSALIIWAKITELHIKTNGEEVFSEEIGSWKNIFVKKSI